MKLASVAATTIISSLLNDEKFAEEKINDYCVWKKENIPFSYYMKSNQFQTAGKLYARSGDIFRLLEMGDYQKFNHVRNYHREWFLELGSLVIKDSGLRAEIVRNAMYTTTWLHNSCSVAAALLCYQDKFNAFVGGKVLAPYYNMSYLKPYKVTEKKETSKVVKLVKAS